MEVSTVLILMGGIITLGFAGSIFFERTRIPDLLILVAIGALLGPILHILDPEQYVSIAPYFGAFALILILFEGGLELHFDKVIGQLGPSLVLVIFAFILSMLGVAYSAHLIGGLELSRALLLGAILGCTSSAIVIPVAARLQISGESKTILNLESAVGDAFAVIATITLTDLIASGSGEANPSNVGQRLVWGFGLAIVTSLVIGLIWLWLLSFVGQTRFSYIVTLGILLIIQGVIEHFHGSGALAILLFGMVLANGVHLSGISGTKLKPKIETLFVPGAFHLEDKIKEFHGEFTFFIRTFFFVYLGFIANFKGVGLNLYILTSIIFVAILIARLVSVYVASWLFKLKSKLLIWSMMPRGLTSAVLAFIPIERGVSGVDEFVNYVFLTVILTNIVLTIGVFISEKRNSSQAEGL